MEAKYKYIFHKMRCANKAIHKRNEMFIESYDLFLPQSFDPMYLQFY